MKKKVNSLKIMRVILALLFFIPFLFTFVDFTDKTNNVAKIAHFQVIPALVCGMIGILGILLLLSFIFGRVYCSTLCPFGVLQDALERVTTYWMKKKKRLNRYGYKKPMNKLRYILLAITLIVFFAGSAELLLKLDPYSNFGRIAANIFSPIYTGINNLAQMALLHFDNYALYYRGIYIVWASFAFSMFVLLTIAVAVFLSGRIFCNTLCPAGALLSLVSRYSIFKIKVDKTLCNNCGLCEKGCKAQCIDSKNKEVDASRCVGCFNCLSACTKGGIKYKRTNPLEALKKRQPEKEAVNETSKSRREFIATSATIAGSLPLMGIKADTGEANVPDRSIPILPPGAKSLDHFNKRCTACHLCVAKCPTHVLKPAALQYGFGFMLKPHVDYSHGFCHYECALCSRVCPNGAIETKKGEKKLIQIGIAEFIVDRCIVYTEGTDCGACSEHCPTQAVHMVPYEGTLTIPKLTEELCIGCGGCEYICPVRPIRAINIIASKVQGTATPPEIEEKVEIKVDDFGF